MTQPQNLAFQRVSSSFHLQKGGSHLAASKSLVWLAKCILLFQIEAGFCSRMWAWQPCIGINRLPKKKNLWISVCEPPNKKLGENTLWRKGIPGKGGEGRIRGNSHWIHLIFAIPTLYLKSNISSFLFSMTSASPYFWIIFHIPVRYSFWIMTTLLIKGLQSLIIVHKTKSVAFKDPLKLGPSACLATLPCSFKIPHALGLQCFPSFFYMPAKVYLSQSNVTCMGSSQTLMAELVALSHYWRSYHIAFHILRTYLTFLSGVGFLERKYNDILNFTLIFLV